MRLAWLRPRRKQVSETDAESDAGRIGEIQLDAAGRKNTTKGRAQVLQVLQWTVKPIMPRALMEKLRQLSRLWTSWCQNISDATP